MLLIRNAGLLREIIQSQKALHRPVGFTPTMGALHPGHLSLIRQSRSDNAVSVCSIFVNPTQFNEAEDLEKYPRTPIRDAELLQEVGCDILFLPDVEEVYPPGERIDPKIELGTLDQVMEGAHRPGHFKGVVQVVSRLLDLVDPDQMYMGQKDFQQFTIIDHMIQQQGRKVKLRMGSTIREADGLAMSSRNVRLSPENRAKAPNIHRLLLTAKKRLGKDPIKTIERESIQALKTIGFRPEYFKIVDAANLRPLKQPNKIARIVACVAVWAGDVRLIDNLLLKDG